MQQNFCLSLLAVQVNTSLNNVDKLKTCHPLLFTATYVCIAALTFHSGKPVSGFTGQESGLKVQI